MGWLGAASRALRSRGRTVSILVSTSDGGRTFHRTYPIGRVRAIAAAGVFLWLLGLGCILLFIRQLGIRGELQRTQRLTDSLRTEFARIDEVEAELARMGLLDKQLKALVGIPVEGRAETVVATGDTAAAGKTSAPTR